MAFPLAAVPAIVGIGKQIFGGKSKGPDYRRAIAELRASQPVGYLTPADMRAAELTRGRLAEGVQGEARLGGYEIGRRFRARGLAGSPAEERSRARLEADKLLGIEHAGTSAEEQLYNIRTGREGYERQKALNVFSAQIGGANQQYERQQAEQGAFWNSLNEFIPTITGALGTGTDYSKGLITGSPELPIRPTGAYEPSGFVPGPSGFK
jgi:hypothetical protein